MQLSRPISLILTCFYVFFLYHIYKSSNQLYTSTCSAETKQVEKTLPENGERFYKAHHVFSTDCSPYHDWQSIGLIESWLNLNKPYNLTRLISCDGTLPDRVLRMKEAYPEVNFYQVKSAKTFMNSTLAFLNKPTSVYQWTMEVEISEDFVIVTDPDWVLLEPFDIRGCAKGKPLTAIGFSADHYHEHPTWRKICGTICDKLKYPEEYQGYNVGHVYVAHRDDMKKLAAGWSKWSRYIRERNDQDIQGGGHMVDMYGYQLAAMEHKLPHEIREYFDLSHPDDPKTTRNFHFQALHYCQAIKLGGFHWSKHGLSDDSFLQCNSTAHLALPPLTE